MKIPGVGVLTATAVVAAMGDPAAFRSPSSPPGSAWCRGTRAIRMLGIRTPADPLQQATWGGPLDWPTAADSGSGPGGRGIRDGGRQEVAAERLRRVANGDRDPPGSPPTGEMRRGSAIPSGPAGKRPRIQAGYKTAICSWSLLPEYAKQRARRLRSLPLTLLGTASGCAVNPNRAGARLSRADEIATGERNFFGSKPGAGSTADPAVAGRRSSGGERTSSWC